MSDPRDDISEVDDGDRSLHDCLEDQVSTGMKNQKPQIVSMENLVNDDLYYFKVTKLKNEVLQKVPTVFRDVFESVQKVKMMKYLQQIFLR